MPHDHRLGEIVNRANVADAALAEQAQLAGPGDQPAEEADVLP